MDDVVRAKVEQAASLLAAHDIPVWIVQFGRETFDHPQPVQQLLVGTSVTWPAAFVITAAGTTHAIVGTGDLANVREIGAYADVRGYVQDIGPPLRDLLAELDGGHIAVSYSLSDDSADNISHGMYLQLERALEATPHGERLVSAEQVLTVVRARKLPIEVERMRRAIGETESLFDLIEATLRLGVREREVAKAVHEATRRQGWQLAWDPQYDPAINFGPAAAFGHSRPGEIALERGMTVHVDLGIKVDGYCSDLQRTWYVSENGEMEAPEAVRRPFDLLVRSMAAGFDALRPGVPGWKVDAAAREVIVEGGYAEPEFSLGHQLGQTTHDGGALLGPRWPRYGDRPAMAVEEGNVFTLEYGLPSPAGWIGLEEDVEVTADGARYLSEPQTTLRAIKL